jgi:hypothetical protein
MEAAPKRTDLGMTAKSGYRFSDQIMPSQQETAMNMIERSWIIFQGMRSQS